MTEVVVRRAGPADAETLHGLISALAAHQDESAHVAATAASLAAAMSGAAPRASFLIAERNGAAAGYLSWVRSYSIWRGGDYLNLDDLYVVEAVRGAGVGEALMRRFMAVAGEEGLPMRWELKPDNDGARRFYDRLGAQMSPKLIARLHP